MSQAPERLAWQDAIERASSNRLWAAMMLATTPEVWRSIAEGKKVLVGQLHKDALRRALRGGHLPLDGMYIQVSEDMLDAVAEAGPLE